MPGRRLVVLLVAAALPGLSEQQVQVSKPSDREIVITASFAAPQQKVFEALTYEDQLPRWFQPSRMSLVTYAPEFKPGGTTRFVFRRPSGKTIEMRHAYQEIDAPRRWVHSETYDFSPIRLTVTTLLSEQRGSTTFTQTIRYASGAERDEDYDAVASSATETYERLDRFLKSSR